MATEPVNERPLFPSLSRADSLGVSGWSIDLVRQLVTVFQQYGYKLNKTLLDEHLAAEGGSIPEVDRTNTWVPVQVFQAAPTATGHPLRWNELARNGGKIPETDRVNNFSAMPTINGDSFVWATKAIGEVFGLRDDLAGVEVPPTNNAAFRYVKLTAGEDGVGQYNEGVLTTETISGSVPLVVATAVINHAASPIDGATINLLNTEGRYPKPGTSAGTVANDQMQGHHHEQWGASTGTGTTGSSGQLLSLVDNGTQNTTSTDANRTAKTDGSNGAPRIGTSTDVKHQQLTYYMRIA